MSKPVTVKLTLISKRVCNDKFTHFRFELNQPETLEFKAGQYLMVTVDDQRTRRSYSIANSPYDDRHLEIFLDVTPDGVGVNYLMDLEEGDQIEALAPIGRFVVDTLAEVEQSLIFIATGCGIAPLRSMVLDRLNDPDEQRQLTLYWGLRYPEQIVFKQELEKLAQEHDNFDYYIVLSRSELETPDCTHVTDCLNEEAVKADAGYYLCGNNRMIDEVVGILAKNQVPSQQIHHEKFDLSSC